MKGDEQIVNSLNVSNKDLALTWRLDMLAMSFRHKTTDLLYFWGSLRNKARNTGGYFDVEELTKHQRYSLLPKLRKRGWVDKKQNKILSHRKIASKMSTLSIVVRMPNEYLESKEKFKTFIMDSVVKYQLEGIYRYTEHQFIGKNIGKKRFDFRDKSYYRKNKLDRIQGATERDTEFRQSYYRVRKFNSDGIDTPQYQGKLSRGITAGFMGISEATISRLRKSSNTFGQVVTKERTSTKGAKSTRERYHYNRRIYDHPSQIHPMFKYYYDSGSNKYFTIDSTCTTFNKSYIDKYAKVNRDLGITLSCKGLFKTI